MLFRSKKGRKRSRIPFDFFQLFLSFFSPKRNSKGKKRRKNHSPLLSHFLPQNRKKEEKEGEKKQKKSKKRRKRRIYSCFFHLLSILKIEKKEEKRKKFLFGNGKREGLKKEEGRNTRFQGHEKEKDLVHHGDEQGLKLCGFVFSKR